MLNLTWISMFPQMKNKNPVLCRRCWVVSNNTPYHVDC
jgi:hypothetical protein